jgi:hypothetical protein
VTSEKAMGFTHDKKNNETVDWWTPKWVFDDLGLDYDLDPCSPTGGVPWLPAKRHYARPQDGLALPWEGRVWLNPPYGKFTGEWLAKMHNHRKGVSLVFARTDCRWFHDYVSQSDGILLLKGRIAFVDGYGATKSQGAGAGSMLVSWGPEETEALRGMSHKGLFFQPLLGAF